jgi:hypothetical protein
MFVPSSLARCTKYRLCGQRGPHSRWTWTTLGRDRACRTSGGSTGGEAFDVHLVCNGTLEAAGAGHHDSVTIGGPWGGPVYVGDVMRGPFRRSEAINKGRRGYGHFWGSVRHKVSAFPVAVGGAREWAPGRGRVHIGFGIDGDAKGSFARAAMKGVIERVDLHGASSAVFPAGEAD